MTSRDEPCRACHHGYVCLRCRGRQLRNDHPKRENTATRPTDD